MRGVFAELRRHRQRPEGRQARAVLLPGLPLAQHLGRSAPSRKRAQGCDREVGPSCIPSCFPLLKLHYLLQCKKYPGGGEECLIHIVSTSCFVFSFFVCGKRLMIILFPICPSSILFSCQVLFFFLLPLHQ